MTDARGANDELGKRRATRRRDPSAGSTQLKRERSDPGRTTNAGSAPDVVGRAEAQRTTNSWLRIAELPGLDIGLADCNRLRLKREQLDSPNRSAAHLCTGIAEAIGEVVD